MEIELEIEVYEVGGYERRLEWRSVDSAGDSVA